MSFAFGGAFGVCHRREENPHRRQRDLGTVSENLRGATALSIGNILRASLLVNVARRLEKCIRNEDMVSRFGDDEFAVLLNGLKNSTDAVATAERIQEELALPFNLAGHEVFCGGSIGGAFSTLDYTQSEEI